MSIPRRARYRGCSRKPCGSDNLIDGAQKSQRETELRKVF
jgi:hypothetical protein